MHGLGSTAITWRVGDGGKGDLSHSENIKNGQMWVQLLRGCNFGKGLKGGKAKAFYSFSHLFIQQIFPRYIFGKKEKDTVK